MGTKAKSNGDGSIKIQAMDFGTATATKKAKGKKEIAKPEKALREPLQHKKELLEQLGWTITERADKMWSGERLSGDDPWGITENNISALLNSIIGIEETHLISDLTGDESIAMLEWRVEGWTFEQDEDQMWSATKGDEFAGKMSDLRPLFSYIEGVETGDHGAAIEKMTAEIIATEKKKYEDEGWRFVEGKSFVEVPGKDNTMWRATNSSPAFPAQLSNQTLPGIFDRIRELQKENSEKLEQFIEKNSTKSDAPSHTELHRRAVKTAKYEALIKNVVVGHRSFDRVETELETKFGEDWYDAFDRLSETEFKDSIKTLWLGDCDGDEDDLRDEYRTPRVESVSVSDFSNSPVVELSLDEISVSEFTPQWHRRRRFKPEDLAELADSIKNQGLINPITVRRVNVRVVPGEKGYFNLFFPDKDGGTTSHCGGMTLAAVEAEARRYSHEIVAGERRFAASQLAGLDKILCFVRDLTDEQALEIQLQENLQRVDVNPLDEAFSYKYLMDNQRMTVADLMVKFGKTEKYITLRLKLNNLIPEVLDVVASGQLPLGHAVEISKFDTEKQPDVLHCCFDTTWQSGKGHVADFNKPMHLKSALRQIASEVLHNLKDAPFPIKDKRLRADGLICPNCPQRTGANDPMSLFEEYREDGADRCLNPSCYQAKTERFIQIKRDDATKKVKRELNCADDYQIRVLAYHSRNKPLLSRIFGDGVLTDGEYKHCYGNPCKSAQSGIFLDPEKYKFGEVIQICLDKNCTKHRSGSSTATTATGEKTDQEKVKFYERKQEIFDVKIGEQTRKKVLREAAKTFTGTRWVFDDEKWRLRLVERVWSRIDDNAKKVINEALGREQYSITESSLKTLSTDELSRVLFLSIIANEAEMLWGNWKDQKQIVAVAEEFGVDYALLDAKERAVEAPKKFKQAAYDHLAKVEKGEKAERPVFYKLEK